MSKTPVKVCEAKLERNGKVYVKRCSSVKSTMQWLYQCEAKAQVVKIIILVGTLEKCASDPKILFNFWVGYGRKRFTELTALLRVKSMYKITFIIYLNSKRLLV
ncbi:hypothetical protein [Leptospira interrogans]|uniref:hypothetical protein n=1 Tax=Leptospira interrogans TaxID=173 RepID=UPI00051A3A3A|nr:hypothetical protein [Leptospira interrogans]